MQRILILVVILAVAAGTYVLLSRTDPEPDTTVDDGGVVPAPPPDDGGEAELMAAKRSGPKPEAEFMQLKAPSSLLMVAGIRESWAATLELTFGGVKELDYRTWYLRDVQNPDKTEGMPGAGRGLTELTGRPTAEYLENENIRVLVLDQADPNALSAAFWDVVARRVRSGSMGLYVRPGFPMNEAGQAQSVHPVLTHPVLKELLPVLEATSIEGKNLAGTFKKKQLMGITPAGTRHPATRLLDEPAWSAETWKDAGVGRGAWGTTFCYPVQTVREGASVLAHVEAATPIPALVVSAAPARVLWQGNIDFGGRETHFTLEKDALRKILLSHYWVWLAGQSE